jgi:phage terminase large subunit
VPDSEKWPITADSARPETISYMQKHGFPKIMPAIKGAKSLEEGVEFLKSFDIVCTRAANT